VTGLRFLQIRVEAVLIPDLHAGSDAGDHHLAVEAGLLAQQRRDQHPALLVDRTALPSDLPGLASTRKLKTVGMDSIGALAAKVWLS
jgi:hypothetical protein